MEKFLSFLDRRIMNEVFYEFKEIKNQSDMGSEYNVDIILHFLAKLESNIILYETKQVLRGSKDREIDKQVIEMLKEIFLESCSSLSLVKGKIREIFLSYSS
jgi:hypothetical protein